MKKRDSPEPRLCGGCGSSERHILLHYVRLRGSFQRLCTNCVLKNHAGLFCSFCLDLINLPPPPRGTLTCVMCPSVAHRSCVAANGSNFECPPCSNSSFSFFSGAGEFAGKKQQLLGKESAKAFVAAAKIAASSIRKAAAAARSDAERRVREAVAAKKRAREALEVLEFLVSKEKEDEQMEEERGEKEKAKSKAMQVLANMATCTATRPSEFWSNAMEDGG